MIPVLPGQVLGFTPFEKRFMDEGRSIKWAAMRLSCG
jgi:hypothetical protein